MKTIRDGASPDNTGSHHPLSRARRFSACGLHALILSTAIGLCLNANAQAITGGLHGTAPTAAGVSVIVTNPATGYAKAI